MTDRMLRETQRKIVTLTRPISPMRSILYWIRKMISLFACTRHCQSIRIVTYALSCWRCLNPPRALYLFCLFFSPVYKRNRKATLLPYVLHQVYPGIPTILNWNKPSLPPLAPLPLETLPWKKRLGRNNFRVMQIIRGTYTRFQERCLNGFVILEYSRGIILITEHQFID